MHVRMGTNYPNESRYKEVEIPERLLFDQSAALERRTPFASGDFGFSRQRRGTEILMRMIFPSAAEREQPCEGILCVRIERNVPIGWSHTCANTVSWAGTQVNASL